MATCEQRLHDLFLVSLNKISDDEIIDEINKLITEFGLEAVTSWKADNSKC